MIDQLPPLQAAALRALRDYPGGAWESTLLVAVDHRGRACTITGLQRALRALAASGLAVEDRPRRWRPGRSA